MSPVEKILRFNRKFVKNKGYDLYRTTKLPDKKIAVLSCMDTRLTGLLPAALNFKNGDIKIIKNAGASVTHPFGSVMRSLVLAVYTLGVEEIFVVGHHDCGMQGLEPAAMIRKMLERGIPRDRIDMIRSCGVDLEGWLRGFDSVESSVLDTVYKIRNHPLMPPEINVVGLLMDPVTGKLDKIESPAETAADDNRQESKVKPGKSVGGSFSGNII